MQHEPREPVAGEGQEQPPHASRPEPSAPAGHRRARPRRQHVLLEQGQRRVVRLEQVPRPRKLHRAERRLPVVEHAVGLGERLAGIAEVVRALVAGERLVGEDERADLLVGRPALRPPVRRGPGEVAPVQRDVVAVLVRDDLLDRRPVGGHLSRDDELLQGREVARLDLGRPARRLHLVERGHVDRRLRELVPVNEVREELGPVEVQRVVDRIRVRDEDAHGLAGRGGVRAPVRAREPPARRRQPARDDPVAHDHPARDAEPDPLRRARRASRRRRGGRSTGECSGRHRGRDEQDPERPPRRHARTVGHAARFS